MTTATFSIGHKYLNASQRGRVAFFVMGHDAMNPYPKMSAEWDQFEDGWLAAWTDDYALSHDHDEKPIIEDEF